MSGAYRLSRAAYNSDGSVSGARVKSDIRGVPVTFIPGDTVLTTSRSLA
jgi:hypothetical protein